MDPGGIPPGIHMDRAFNRLWAQYNAPRAAPPATIHTAHRSNNIDDVIDSYINPEQLNATSELDKYQQ
jgi:hypothetical protein